MTTAPELKAALTNEVTFKKISVALNALFGIPKNTYTLSGYREQDKPNQKDTLLVELVLEGLNHVYLTIYISGPRSRGQYMWGFNQDAHAMTVSQKLVDGVLHTYYIVRGYLRPEKT